ncbi:hypothetical protein GLOIN_2v1845756 [Rhizophagus irregularis DAOM 181602=DAOM 197198]|nr:hypothetical protein GLOIN_2v1845756 [Rhizophagus irregularis DAOM 181602=DAOM 197198]
MEKSDTAVTSGISEKSEESAVTSATNEKEDESAGAVTSATNEKEDESAVTSATNEKYRVLKRPPKKNTNDGDKNSRKAISDKAKEKAPVQSSSDDSSDSDSSYSSNSSNTPFYLTKSDMPKDLREASLKGK